MRGLDRFSKVFLHRDPVDMRKSINGLSMIVMEEMKESSAAWMSEDLFVFVSRCGKRLKMLYWDRSGFALWDKRLERERFRWPKQHGDAVLTIDTEQLEKLLLGFDVFQKPHDFLHDAYA